MPPFQFTGAFQFESLLWQFGGDLFSDDVDQGHLGLRGRRQGADVDDAT